MLTNTLITPGLKVLIVGFGVSGRAALRYLQKCGAEVTVADARPVTELKAEEHTLIEQYAVAYQGGDQGLELLEGIELVFVSPGIANHMALLEEARRRNIPVVGELALAGPAISAPVVAITGTNGKTTVTSLIGELLEKAGKKVFVGGNIGVPLFDYLIEGQNADVVVLEVSSFQLENCGEFSPQVALLLNVTPDHLDRHGSLEEYRNAKAKIFTNQGVEDYAILCADDDQCRVVKNHLTIQKVCTFGYQPDCQAVIADNGVEVKLEGSICFDLQGSALNNRMGRLNSSAAILTLYSLGIEMRGILDGLKCFALPPHRMEKVCELDGVVYINDSKATNTGAVVSALEQIEGRVFLIAGGRDKGDDYNLLLPAVKRKVEHVFLLGEAAEKIQQSLENSVPISRVESMKEAVLIASKKAQRGDTVLLSPACASFDMFKSYGHRGQMFSEAVTELCNEGAGG